MILITNTSALNSFTFYLFYILLLSLPYFCSLSIFSFIFQLQLVQYYIRFRYSAQSLDIYITYKVFTPISTHLDHTIQCKFCWTR